MRNRGISFILVVCLLFSLFWCDTGFASDGQNLPLALRLVLVKAQKAIDKKCYRDAEKIITDYLSGRSNKPHYLAYYILGNAYYLDKKIKQAYHAYSQSYKLNPSYRPACVNLAKVSYDLRKYREAGDLFIRAYEISKKPNPDFLYEAGVAYYQGKHYRQAKAVLQRLMKEIKPIKVPWLKLFVFTCLELKDWNSAERCLLSLLSRTSTNDTYWKLLAQVRLQKGDYKGAASALEIAYRLKPPPARRWKELADIYLYIGVPLKAARCLERAYGVNPFPKQLDEIARAYAMAHRAKDAVNYYLKAIEKEPTASRYLEIAKLYYRNGMWKKAVVALERSIKLNPRNGLAHLLLGYCAWQLDNKKLAVRELNAASKHKRYRQQAQMALNIIKETEDLGQNTKD